VQPRKGKDFELKLGKLGLTVFILGMSLALLVVFAFGVKVGKDIDSYPAKIVGIIPGLQGKVLGRPESEKKADGTGEKGNFKLGFYESLSGKRADSPDDMQQPQVPPAVQKDGPVPEVPPGAAQPGTSAVNAAPVTPEGAKPETRPEARPQPKPETARKAEEPKPEARKLEKGKFFIQVAALKSEAKARELKSKLVKLGYAPKLEAVNNKAKGKVYRIRIMGFATQQEAAKVMGKLGKQVPGTNCLIHKESE